MIDSKVTILLETMAGKGTEVGSNLEEIKDIIAGITNQDRIGICLDTCHLSDAGHDIKEFDKVVKTLEDYQLLDKVKCLHINDSKIRLVLIKIAMRILAMAILAFLIF